MEQTEYKQIVARLEGLTDAQFDALLETLRHRKDADGVQRLVMARLAERQCCPYCEGGAIVNMASSLDRSDSGAKAAARPSPR